MFCAYCRPAESVNREPIAVIPLSPSCMNTEIPGAVGGVDETCRDSGSYEPLQGNIYNTLDEPPAPPSTLNRPKKPISIASLDENGYLGVRDSTT